MNLRTAPTYRQARFGRRPIAALMAVALFAAFCAGPGAPALGQTQQLQGQVTELPLPRFVSLKADTINVRRGPSKEHQVQWVYKRKGMPVEIIAEFDRWRRIRDVDGDTGWIYHSLLAGARTALITGKKEAALYSEAGGNSLTALAEPGVIARLSICRPSRCEVSAGGYTGWVSRRSIWGVYPGETLE